MSDVPWGAFWLLVLMGGVGACLVLHRVGLAATYARDLLHVGAGVWVLGWPLWRGRTVPIAIASLTALATACVPIVARRSARVAWMRDAFAGGDERWGGLVLYAVSFATLTAVGLCSQPLPAGAALLALSLGDGLGGAVGRRFGAHRFHVPGGKQKSLEGSVTVALGAFVGISIAAWRLGGRLDVRHAVALAVIAALAEALSPRGADNIVVPVAGWGGAQLSELG
jgi:dolichol kinase